MINFLLNSWGLPSKLNGDSSWNKWKIIGPHPYYSDVYQYEEKNESSNMIQMISLGHKQTKTKTEKGWCSFLQKHCH